MWSCLFDIGHSFEMDHYISMAFFLWLLENFVQLSSQSTQALAEEKEFVKFCLLPELESIFGKENCHQFVLNPKSRNSF